MFNWVIKEQAHDKCGSKSEDSLVGLNANIYQTTNYGNKNYKD